MDDIVERLREHLKRRELTHGTHWDGCIDSHPISALAWTLDEIERLRAMAYHRGEQLARAWVVGVTGATEVDPIVDPERQAWSAMTGEHTPETLADALIDHIHQAQSEIQRLRRALVSTQESVVAYEKLYGQGEAAAEIELLTQERNMWQATAAGLSQDISNVEDEIERLRNELADWQRTVRAYEEAERSRTYINDDDVPRLKLIAKEACEQNHGPIIDWCANEIARMRSENRRLSLDLMVAISENAGMYDLEPRQQELSEKATPFLTNKPNLCPCCHEHVGSTDRSHVHPCLEAQQMLQNRLAAR